MLELRRNYCIKEVENLIDFVISASIMNDNEIITLSVVVKLLSIESKKSWFCFYKG